MRYLKSAASQKKASHILQQQHTYTRMQSYVDVHEAKDGEGPQLLALLDALEEDPDVQQVHHNARLV